MIIEQEKTPVVYGNYWTKEDIEDCKKKNKLLRVAVAIPGGEKNNECNMNCIFCFTGCGTRYREKKNVTNEIVRKFLAEASKYAYKPELMNYYFVSEGEPTLNKELVNILEETSKLGGTMTIFTNLYYITDEQIQAFKKIKNLFVCGKLYGMKPETNDYLTNTKGSYNKMMNNIQKLKENGLAQEKRLGIQCVVNSYNYDEVFDIFKWARKNEIVPHIMMYRKQGLGEKFPELAISQEKLLDLYKKCAEFDKKELNVEWKAKLPLLVIGDCSVPGVNLYLTTNGDITVCAGDTRKYGNYFETSIEEAMKSELYQDVKNNYKKCPWVEI